MKGDYPRCATCDHYRVYRTGEPEMVCESGIVTANMLSLYTPPDENFGCVAHYPKAKAKKAARIKSKRKRREYLRARLL